MTNEEAIKELREASDSEVRYGDTEHHYNEVMKRIEAFEMAIKALEQQKTGHWWARNTYPQESECWDCSECKETVFEQTNYCPNCGADMRGEKNEDGD